MTSAWMPARMRNTACQPKASIQPPARALKSMPPRPLPMKQMPMARPRRSSNQLEMMSVKGKKVRKDVATPTTTETA